MAGEHSGSAAQHDNILDSTLCRHRCRTSPEDHSEPTHHCTTRYPCFEVDAMVYTGKPSRGCLTCRKRRIKCDEARPVCSQCTKSKRTCAGYRDEADLLFRNENSATANRAKRGNSSGIVRSRIAPYENRSGVVELSWSSVKISPLVQYVSPISKDLGQGLEQQALCLFFSDYVLTPRHPETTRGFLEYLLPLYNDAKTDSALAETAIAISVATLSARPNRRYLRLEAARRYGSAVSRIKSAIADPVEARSDQTLMSVLLFSLYENWSISFQALRTWGRHVDGAAALIRLRGEEMLKTTTSLNLYCAVRTLMVTQYTSKCEPLESIPDFVGDWTKSYIDNAANRLTMMTASVPAVRARARMLLDRPRTAENFEKIQELIANARQADHELAKWPSTLPDSWSYKPIAFKTDELNNPMQEEIYTGPIDCYYDVWVASVWNSYRCARIFLQGVVFSCLEWLLPPPRRNTMDEYRQTVLLLQTLVNEICHSVPFMQGYQTPLFEVAESAFPSISARDYSSGPRYRPTKMDHKRNVTTLGGYFLVWTLKTCGKVPCIPEIQDRWISGRLMSIARHYGLAQPTAPVEQKQNEEFASGKDYSTIVDLRSKPLLDQTQALEDFYARGCVGNNFSWKIADHYMEQENLPPQTS